MARTHHDHTTGFLAGTDTPRRHLNGEGCPPQLTPEGFFLGKPNIWNARLEITLFGAGQRPSGETVRRAWNWRGRDSAAPVVMIAIHGERATLWGPQREDPPVWSDLPVEAVERLCIEILRQLGPEQALRFLQDAMPQLGGSLAGILNRGMLSLHALETSRRWRDDWPEAEARAQRLIGSRDNALINALGFTSERLDNLTSLLRAGQDRTALAVMLREDEAPNIRADRFNDSSPVTYAMTKAGEEGLRWVIMVQGQRIRLYSTEKIGVSHRGRTATFIECQTALVNHDYAGLLWLIFSAEALRRNGSFSRILGDSRDYATGVATRLRERVYDIVVPRLAEGITEARGLNNPSRGDLALSFEMALTVLFRLLFIAYGEDRELLPWKANARYDDHALKRKARHFADNPDHRIERPDEHQDDPQDDPRDDHWVETQLLFSAIGRGNSDWGVPAYNGVMFSDDRAISRAGAELSAIRIRNRHFEPALRALLTGPSGETEEGPVDFRDLSVREFGAIYEGLLESELSRAEQDLTRDRKGAWIPAGEADPVHVRAGEVYLHDRSGARKASGSYYTPEFAVEHLLDGALEPALTDHLERVSARLAAGDEAGAAEMFFAFSVADIAMGSGHFLIAAIDRIETRFSEFLAANSLPAVRRELADLRAAATLEMRRQLGAAPPIEDGQLLRRQIARRCIYGVDMNPLAVQLARLSVWIHSFVPGLPLSLLDHHLVTGNALVGVGTFDDITRHVEGGIGGMFAVDAEALLGEAKEPLHRLAALSDASISDIREGRELRAGIEGTLTPTRALCDLVTAAPVAGDPRLRDFPFEQWDRRRPDIAGSREMALAGAVLRPLRAFHFPVAFPEVFLRDDPGFNTIIGNPPWEEVVINEDKFWGRHQPGLSGLSPGDQESLKAQLRQARPDLVAELEGEVSAAGLTRGFLTSGNFPGMGTGDPDLYKAFCWRFWHLSAAERGRFGVVLPRSAMNAKGSETFRKGMFGAVSFLDVVTLKNRKRWIFDITELYTIALTIAQKGNVDEATIILRGPFTSQETFDKGVRAEAIRIHASEVMRWNDSASLPQLPRPDSLGVFLQLRKAPRLDLDNGASWRARPDNELHATGQKHLMDLTSERCPEGFWPIWKGASFDIWQPAGAETNGFGDPDEILRWLQQKRLRSFRGRGDSVHREFPRDHVEDTATLAPLRARLAFRDIARSTDARTMIVALIPPRTFLTNKAPYLLFPRGEERDEAYLLGILCSRPLDWYARRFVETNLNFFIFNPLPVPRPSRDDPLWQRVVALAGRLACPDDRFADWADAVGVACGPLDPKAKDEMTAELDAVAAHLYGLDPDQLTHIFETFHTGWNHHDRLQATMTHYERWKGKTNG